MKLGISLLPNFSNISSIEDFLRLAHDLNLQTVELIAEPPLCFVDEITSEERLRLKTLAKELNLELTIHSCFSDINIAAINPRIQRACLEVVKSSIAFASDVGAKIVTIHPGGFGANGIVFPQESIKNNFQAVKELAEYTSKQGIRLGYENFPFVPWQLFDESFKPKEIQQFIERIGNKALGITWDVGHANTTNLPLELFFEHFQNHLVNIHIHDNNGPSEGWADQHLSLGQGTVPWEKFFDLMTTISYDGAFILELNSKEQISSSLAFLQKLL